LVKVVVEGVEFDEAEQAVVVSVRPVRPVWEALSGP